MTTHEVLRWLLFIAILSTAVDVAVAQSESPRAVAFISVADTSGSMRPFVRRLAEAERGQLKRLAVGDTYARIEFDGDARLTAIATLRDPRDLAHLLSIESRGVVGQFTELSRGLARARDVVNGLDPDVQVVLTVMTDGVLDARDGQQAELSRLDASATWWKSQARVTRLLVAPGVETSAPFRSLARTLDARIIALESYARDQIAQRAIDSARRATPAAGRPAARRSLPIAWLTGLVVLIGIAVMGVVRHVARTTRAVRRAEPPASAAPLTEVAVRITAGGVAKQYQIAIDDDEERAPMTFGGQGSTFPLPGYSGETIKLVVGEAQSYVVVPAGVAAHVGADKAPPEGMTASFSGRTAVRTHGVHAAIVVRSLNAHRPDEAHHDQTGLSTRV